MLGGLDLAVFLVCLAAVMGIGLLAGGRGQSSEEYLFRHKVLPIHLPKFHEPKFHLSKTHRLAMN